MNEKPIAPSALPLPTSIKPQTYERRKFEAVFHRMDLVIEFIPGINNIGAIVKKYMNGIPNHDIAAKNVEDIKEEE